MLSTARAVIDGLHEQIVAEERAIEEIFTRFGCSHAYLDVGANIGVQIRKVYESGLYPGARSLPMFEQAFGQAPRCNVCSIGIEPNPIHAPRLSHLATTYQEAGAGVLILAAAASDADGVTRLSAFNRTDWWIRQHGGVNLQIAARSAEDGPTMFAEHDEMVTVRTVDLSRIIHAVDRQLVRRHGGNRTAGRIVMKMDIEGAEHRVLPKIVRADALCRLDRVYIEWHGYASRDSFLSALNSSRCRSSGLYDDMSRNRRGSAILLDETYRDDARTPWPRRRGICPDRDA